MGRSQTAQQIIKELIKVFSCYGIPDILHSDQGKNFESAILRQTLDAFGIAKSHTMAYHPAGDGLVERFNTVQSKGNVTLARYSTLEPRELDTLYSCSKARNAIEGQVVNHSRITVLRFTRSSISRDFSLKY